MSEKKLYEYTLTEEDSFSSAVSHAVSECVTYANSQSEATSNAINHVKSLYEEFEDMQPTEINDSEIVFKNEGIALTVKFTIPQETTKEAWQERIFQQSLSNL